MHPLIRDVQKGMLKKVPEIKPGYTVRVYQKIKEVAMKEGEKEDSKGGAKERVQMFEGLVIAVSSGEGVEKNITVRKVVEGIGVEKIFPLHSVTIQKIEVKKKAKVRRAKLYYMRGRFGKSARLLEHHVTDKERAEELTKMDAYIDEAVKAEEKRKAEEDKKAEEAAMNAPAVTEPVPAPIESAPEVQKTEKL